MEVGSSSSDTSMVQVSFPTTQASVLDSLNRQREDGSLCDLSIHVQGHVFKAHRCVLAASSPYFHDQVLLKNMSSVCIPAVMDPQAFESVLACAYTGQLKMLRDDIVNYLTVGSVLQMWHIVDKCTELLKEGRTTAVGASGSRHGSQDEAGGREQSANPSSSSTGRTAGGDGTNTTAGVSHLNESNQPKPPPQPGSQPLVMESQSPSSTNYFSPRDGCSFGGSGGAAAATSATDGRGANNTPGYCTPTGGEEAFLIEEEDMEEEDEEVYHQRKRGRGGRRKKVSLGSEQEVGVSDSFGVSSYQNGEDSAVPQQKRPTYSQPSIMPRKQWVVVKTEQTEDDDLIVVSGEEGGEEEDEEEEKEVQLASERERGNFNISNVRSLSAELGGRAESDMDSQVDYCHSSEDFFRLEGALMEQTLVQHLQDGVAGTSQSCSRTASTLLGTAQNRNQLFPLDMQGNQILMYGQTPGLLDPGGSSLGGAAAGLGGSSLKSSGLEHGAVHLQSGLGLDGCEGGGGASGSTKVFTCHCGKSFTHRSMRDRHVNMHLDLRPFHCPVCAKKFKMKHHLTEHMKTHTGLKPYLCSLCGKKFMWRDSFMRHRTHCQRRGAGPEGGRPGAARDRGKDEAELLPSPHLYLSAGEKGMLGGTGRGGAAVSTQQQGGGGSAPHSDMGALLGPEQDEGPGVFAALGLGRGGCDEDVCDVSEVSESSVT